MEKSHIEFGKRALKILIPTLALNLFFIVLISVTVVRLFGNFNGPFTEDEFGQWATAFMVGVAGVVTALINRYVLKWLRRQKQRLELP